MKAVGERDEVMCRGARRGGALDLIVVLVPLVANGTSVARRASPVAFIRDA